MFYRADLFDDEGEKAAFKTKYGYDLGVPTDWKQHRDIAEFFTRKKGDNLKGKPLDKDFYGVGLMAGPFPEIQDELSAPIWGMGSDWLTNDGKVPAGDVEKVLSDYLAELKFAPPAALTVTYDGVMNQMKDWSDRHDPWLLPGSMAQCGDRPRPRLPRRQDGRHRLRR